MPADPTLEISEVITFDGDPITALPWGAPQPPAALAPPVSSSPRPPRPPGRRTPTHPPARAGDPPPI
ncbi:hypothetical protein O1M54_41780 [Streptomyces diastatochromogenes]|nr:hypothetical protein [Streptomyces diastatochromogenes]